MLNSYSSAQLLVLLLLCTVVLTLVPSAQAIDGSGSADTTTHAPFHERTRNFDITLSVDSTGDGTTKPVSIHGYRFPGRIRRFWWVNDRDVVALSHGHLFIARHDGLGEGSSTSSSNNGATGGIKNEVVWRSLTESIDDFYPPNRASLRDPTMGIVTNIRFDAALVSNNHDDELSAGSWSSSGAKEEGEEDLGTILFVELLSKRTLQLLIDPQNVAVIGEVLLPAPLAWQYGNGGALTDAALADSVPMVPAVFDSLVFHPIFGATVAVGIVRHSRSLCEKMTSSGSQASASSQSSAFRACLQQRSSAYYSSPSTSGTLGYAWRRIPVVNNRPVASVFFPVSLAQLNNDTSTLAARLRGRQSVSKLLTDNAEHRTNDFDGRVLLYIPPTADKITNGMLLAVQCVSIENFVEREPNQFLAGVQIADRVVSVSQNGGYMSVSRLETVSTESAGGGDSVAAQMISNTAQVVLHVSSDCFANNRLTPAAAFGTHVFPSDWNPVEEELDAQVTGYTFADTDADEVLVGVFRADNSNGAATGSRWSSQNPWVHLYQSGLHGQRFSLSLPYVRQRINSGAAMDLHRVGSLDGVLLANTVLNRDDEQCRNCRNNEKATNQGGSGGEGAPVVALTCEQACVVGTVMSRDNGKTWHQLPPPTDQTFCTDEQKTRGECWLHLHSESSSALSSSLSGIVSPSTVPGLVMATGNVGSSLALDSAASPDTAEEYVFLSRDGGATWATIYDHRGLYGEIGNGGILFVVPTGVRTSSLRYSIDEGATWRSMPLGGLGASYYVLSVVTPPVSHPEARVLQLLAFQGHVALDDPSGQDVVLQIDFSQLKTTLCTKDDFESFQPRGSDGIQTLAAATPSSSSCYLGQEVTYQRKKLGASCWLTRAEEFNELTQSTVRPCACTLQDYECDVGYVLDHKDGGASGACVADFGTSPTTVCYHAGEQVRTSKGYRKISLDGCVGGLDLDPTYSPCPAPGLDPGAHAAGIFAILALIVFGLGAIVLSKAHDEVFLARLPVLLQVAVRWLQNCTRAARRSTAQPPVPSLFDDSDEEEEHGEDGAPLHRKNNSRPANGGRAYMPLAGGADLSDEERPSASHAERPTAAVSARSDGRKQEEELKTQVPARRSAIPHDATEAALKSEDVLAMFDLEPPPPLPATFESTAQDPKPKNGLDLLDFGQ